MSRTIIQGTMLIDRQFVEDQILVWEAGKITYVGPKRDEIPERIIEHAYIVPGYVDVHVHGSNGADVMDGSIEALTVISKSLATYGVTGFLASTLTADLKHLLDVLHICRQFTSTPVEGAALLGVHLEGPWINSRYKGAQNAAFVVPPTLSDAQLLVEAGGGLVKLVTLAPEEPNATQVIAWLAAQSVQVSVGHSDATYESVASAISHGLSHVTHCYNAMRGLHHREPGVVGAAMYHDELTTELIADGIHVHPVTMSILHRLKTAERLVLVSDGMRAVGMSDGEFELGGLQVHMKNGEARLADGTLAGSTLTMERAVQNMVRLCGVPLAEAVTSASETPAKVIGYGHRKGRLQTGYDADFLVLDADLNVVTTYRGGDVVFSRDE